MKQLSLKFLLIISFFLLSSITVFAEPEQQSSAELQTTQQEKVINTTSNEDVSNVPETIPEKNYENLMKFKNSKIFNILIYTLSGIFIFLLALGIYKLKKRQKEKNIIVESPPKETLITPDDFKTAINLFLSKTDE